MELDLYLRLHHLELLDSLNPNTALLATLRNPKTKLLKLVLPFNLL